MASQVSSGIDYNAEYRAIIDSEFPGLLGRQEPQYMLYTAGGDYTHGTKAVELARRFGVRLMPWQEKQIKLSLATDDKGRWLHSDTVLICPRQNGKSLILEVVILYHLFILHNQIIFTAQLWKTAKSIRNRIWAKIKNRKWAARRLVRNTASAGEAEMETADGGKIQFTTRSNDVGRGFDRIDLLMLDESYNLDSAELDAVAPIQLAAPDPQTFYTSSSVNQDFHIRGVELSKIRERAMSTDAPGMLFTEYSAPEGLDPDDPRTWALSNPSYGVVATEKKVRSLQKKLTKTGFEVEMLGWGRWFSATDGEDDFQHLTDLESWAEHAAPGPAAPTDTCLAVEVHPSGNTVGLVVAIKDAGKVHLSAAPVEEFDRDHVLDIVQKTIEVNKPHDPLAIVIDNSGQNTTLIEPLRRLGIAPELPNGGQVSSAYELFMRLLVESKITHDGSPRWLAAWETAVERSKGGRYRSFERYVGDASLLIAASLAIWGLNEFGIPDIEDVTLEHQYDAPAPQSITDSTARPLIGAGLIDTQFAF